MNVWMHFLGKLIAKKRLHNTLIGHSETCRADASQSLTSLAVECMHKHKQLFMTKEHDLCPEITFNIKSVPEGLIHSQAFYCDFIIPMPAMRNRYDYRNPDSGVRLLG